MHAIKKMAVVVAVTVIFFNLTYAKASAELVIYKTFTNWSILKRVDDDLKVPTGCIAMSDTTDYIYMDYYPSEYENTLGIGNKNWNITTGSTYPVYLQYDDDRKVEYTLEATTESTMKILEPPTDFHDTIARSRELTVYTQSSTLTYDLTGSSEAMASLKFCYEQEIAEKPQKQNPFEKKNPFVQNPGNNPINNAVALSDVLIDKSIVEDLFEELTTLDNEIEVKVDLSDEEGYFYEISISNSVITNYGEEHVNNRTVAQIWDDRLTYLRSGCESYATSETETDNYITHDKHSGTVYCKIDEHSQLYFRSSGYILEDRYIEFMSYGTDSQIEAVNAIDEYATSFIDRILNEVALGNEE